MDCEFVLITCFEIFFSFSHDLLEIARLVLDQLNPFWNCSNMQVKNRNGSGEKEQLPGQIQQFIGRRYLKKGSILFPT